MSTHYRHARPLQTQRGAALVFIVVGLTALLLAAALALDVGHATLNESRLQNAVDAAALAAAKIYDNTAGNTALSTLEASVAFGNNANSSGDTELANAYANGNGTITINVTYSATLPPFTAGPVGPYVRVSASGYQRPTWLASLAGISQVTLSATAVAGPSPSINSSCNLVPMMVCGTAPPTPAPANWDYGYTLNAPTIMKLAAPGGGTVGPGNFQLIQLPGGSGANWVRQNLAGGFNGCVTSGNSITTQPGDETGPVADGLDTRFGDYIGNLSGDQSLYPPDVNTTQPNPVLTVSTSGSCSATPCILDGSTVVTAANIDSLKIFDYAAYETALSAQQYTNAPPTGQFNRRILALPVGNCSAGGNGSTSVPIIGFACFFLLQQPTHSGNTDWVLGQYIGNCNTDGTPGPSPSAGPQPYIIQLYRDPSSGNS